jgi:GntR family transcriptional regulator, transcriptional repressor for pyruvate dehydrogenase complex
MMTDMDTGLAPPGRKRRPRSLARTLVDSLSESIRSCVFRPGDKLPTESEIMRQYGVSRTVVREAISSLQAAGLVETRHGIGTFVRSAPAGLEFRIDPDTIITLRDVLAMLELRISLETAAAGLAAARRSEAQLGEMLRAIEVFDASVDLCGDAATPDFQFHLQVAYATGNRYFAEVMSYLGTTTIPRTRINSLPGEGEQSVYLKLVNQQHRDIYEAILRRDPEAARAAMRVHLSRSYERLRRAHDAPGSPGD